MSLSANQHASPSGAAETPATDAEQRVATRYTPLIRAAKIVADSGEFLCVVSDISSTGVSVRIFHRLPRDRALKLEMPNGDRLAIEPVWIQDGRAGFRFDADVNLPRVLSGHGKWPKRPIRLNLAMPVTLSGITGKFEGTIRNISLQGAQVDCAERLAIEQRLRLSSKVLPEIVTKVRWRKGNTYGLVFDTTFQFAELARIIALAQGIALDSVAA